MKNLVKLIFLYTLLTIFSSVAGYSQNNALQADSARIMNKTEQDTKDKKVAPNSQGDNNKSANSQGDINRSTNSQQPVKQIKGARPDMSKARGARPAYIQRQAGSGIPRGIGKPGGAAIKPGKR